MITYLKEQYRLWSLKQPLVKAFEVAGLYLKYRNGAGKELHILPTIHNVSEKGDSTTYTFTLPVGVDPSIIEKKRYCFTQVFGEHVTYEGDSKHIKLIVRKTVSTVEAFDYDYDSVSNACGDYRIPIYCGASLENQPIIYDMVEQPHLLIAGETGSGKSTQLRSILTTLILNNDPARLRLYLADMKRSEFHLFRNVAHVEEVCNKVHQLSKIIFSVRHEIERRGDLLDATELSHIDDYNSTRSDKLPYLVVCIDEVALLKKEAHIMDTIEDISAVGRALGVFLILSMQRPDSDVLDGKLKNNLTVRMGFKCADAINSKIIGVPGAEALTEKGRFLMKAVDTSEIQASYLDLERAKVLLKPYKVAPKPKGQTNAEVLFETFDGGVYHE
jgi:DNA segregation ATPase FtsK/SpoIIIE, S-DNA-T family